MRKMNENGDLDKADLTDEQKYKSKKWEAVPLCKKGQHLKMDYHDSILYYGDEVVALIPDRYELTSEQCYKLLIAWESATTECVFTEPDIRRILFPELDR